MKSNQKPKQQPKAITKKLSFLVDPKKKQPSTSPQKLPVMDSIAQESITESMRSTPSTAQRLASFPAPLSFQSHEIQCKSTDPRKIPNFELVESSPSPDKIGSATPAKLIRKDSRSLTTVNTPDKVTGLNNFNDAASGFNRRIMRTKTEVHKLNTSKSGTGQFSHNYSNSLSSNYKNEKTPSRVLQKDKVTSKNELIVKDIKFREENTEKFEPESSKSFNSYLKNGRRFSVTSNVSLNSFAFNEAQYEMLTELTKSVKELNQRLIKSEEVTYERLKENLALKTKIKNLEAKVDEQKDKRLDTEVLNPGCSTKCLVF